MGYQKITLTANKMDILGAQFNPISGEASIQDITVSGDFGLAGTDWIRWWDAATGRYAEASYWGIDPANYADGVYDPSDTEYESPLGVGWGDADAFIVNGSIPAGKAFWAKAENGGNIIVSGEVVTDGVVTLLANKMDLVCNPFPVDTDIQTISVGGNFGLAGTDWIRWWDAASGRYAEASYWGIDPANYADGVYDPSDTEYENPLGVGWGDADAFIVRATIPAGHGFWAKAENGGTLIFQNPTAPAASGEGND